MGFETEKKTSLWIGLFILAMSIVYVFVTLGKTQWVTWIAIIWGLFLSGLLFIEAGVINYFQKKEWRKLSVGDVVVWITIAFSVVIFLNSLLLIGSVKAQAPDWLINFAKSTGIIAGIGGGILGVVHILMPRFH